MIVIIVFLKYILPSNLLYLQGIEELNKLDTFIHGGVNITGFGIINKKSNLYKNQEKVLTGELKQITVRSM